MRAGTRTDDKLEPKIQFVRCQAGVKQQKILTFIPVAFFDQIFPWSFWSIDQLDCLFHICLEFCHVVPVVLRCVVLCCG